MTALPDWLLALPIESVPVLAVVDALAGVLAVLLLVPMPGVRARPARFLAVALLAAGIGALAGFGLAVWADRGADLFGVPFSTVITGSIVVVGAGFGLVVANLIRTRWWRRIIAILAAPVVLAAGALAINTDVGYYPELGDALGVTGASELVLGADPTAAVPLKGWHPPASLPAFGTVSTVRIPGTESGWVGRDAEVYLPPAALTAHPPKLPVVIALSGQPGTPSDVFDAGGLAETMDGVARRHHGVAPIVVSPDQLGSIGGNPLCVNSKLGQVATYLIRDVRHWIIRHLPVTEARTGWTALGFSEGGTCALQLGAEYGGLLGSVVDVAGELAPSNGSVASTIAAGFHGSRAAYERATPRALLAARRHPDSVAYFAVGQLDTRYAPVQPVLVAAAKRSGMRVVARTMAGYSHNWRTATDAFAWAVRGLEPRWGIDR